MTSAVDPGRAEEGATSPLSRIADDLEAGRRLVEELPFPLLLLLDLSLVFEDDSPCPLAGLGAAVDRFLLKPACGSTPGPLSSMLKPPRTEFTIVLILGSLASKVPRITRADADGGVGGASSN